MKTDDEITITEVMQLRFRGLFEEFTQDYLNTDEGKWHAGAYQQGRVVGRAHFEEVVAAADQGGDITDLVLLKLLPHTDSKAHRERDAWIHLAPTIQGDVKDWFEGAGWTQPEDWPQIAEAILAFVRRCYEHPEELREACQAFDALPYTTGFQTGMMTPILNALRPDDFLLINNKSRRTINYFAGTSWSQKLVDYPDTNVIGLALIEALSDIMHQFDVPEVRDPDLFDMFCHWLSAIKRFDYQSIRYWKVAPGRDAWEWDAWRDEDFVAIGWNEMGDISALSREEFEARRDEEIAARERWTKAGLEQLWKFVHHILPGDVIVANNGISKVLGIGRVTGPYYYVPGERHAHRLPVEWERDFIPRRVEEHGWRRTLVELNQAKLDEIRNAPLVEPEGFLALPFSRIFENTEEAEWAFDLLQETLRILGVTGPEDARFALTLRHNGTVLRLNYGNWAVLQFYAPDAWPYRVGMALFEDRVNLEGDFDAWEPFASRGGEPTIRVYELPIEAVKPLDGELREVYEETFAYIGSRFQHWTSTNYRRHNRPEIAGAVFNQGERDTILEQGVVVPPGPKPNPEYLLPQCAAEVGLDEDTLSRWIRAIERKGQAVLYGPPGTGKTYIAEKLARHLIGGGDGFSEVIQFHPAYAYEDFIQGIRPQPGEEGQLSFDLLPGRFLTFCEEAEAREGRCVLIIDEINRANLSRVFGELMYLLEYREQDVPLAAGGSFSIPQNVRIIGTMNTADRSIALVDHALRRRFAFLPLYPNCDVLTHFHQETGFPVESLVEVLKQLNRQIGNRHYQVGITFFLHEDLEAHLEDIWRMEIVPYLEEYFFDQPGKVDAFRWENVGNKILK